MRPYDFFVFDKKVLHGLCENALNANERRVDQPVEMVISFQNRLAK